MSVGVLLVTHGEFGGILLETARYMMGETPERMEALAVDSDHTTESLDREAAVRIERLDAGSGVLVLTDLIGATPGNVARRMAARSGVAVVYGLNLPMLVKTINYRHLPLDEVVEKAILGGREGILVESGD